MLTPPLSTFTRAFSGPRHYPRVEAACTPRLAIHLHLHGLRCRPTLPERRSRFRQNGMLAFPHDREQLQRAQQGHLPKRTESKEPMAVLDGALVAAPWCPAPLHATLWPPYSPWPRRESRIIVRRAIVGQHPQSAEPVIDCLEQTVQGWKKKPTPFAWHGTRRQRRERARLRRPGGSGAN
jgi:hypothetical protein